MYENTTGLTDKIFLALTKKPNLSVITWSKIPFVLAVALCYCKDYSLYQSHPH